MTIWLQKSASVQPRTSRLTICKSARANRTYSLDAEARVLPARRARQQARRGVGRLQVGVARAQDAAGVGALDRAGAAQGDGVHRGVRPPPAVAQVLSSRYVCAG